MKHQYRSPHWRASNVAVGQPLQASRPATRLFASLAIIEHPALYEKLAFDPYRSRARDHFGEVPLVLMGPRLFSSKTSRPYASRSRGRHAHYGFGVGTSCLFGRVANPCRNRYRHVPSRARACDAAIIVNEIHFLFQNALSPKARSRGTSAGAAVAAPKLSLNAPHLPTFEGRRAKFPRGSRTVVTAVGHARVRSSPPSPHIQTVLDDSAFQQMAALGFELAGGTPQQLAAYVQAERKKWVPIIRALGIKGT